MLVSIIIPSLNATKISQVIKHLEKQTAYNNIGEIIIIGKDDNNLIPENKKIKFIDTGTPVNAAEARNIGIQKAKYDLFIFLDSDCFPSPHWLDEHIKAHRNGHDIVGGGVLPNGSNYWALSYNLSLFHEFLSTNQNQKKKYLPTLNLSIKRHVINKVGLLNESLARGQDIEWTVRMRKADCQLFFNPKATIVHAHNRQTFSKVWKDCARSGYHMRNVRLAHKESLSAPFILHYPLLILLTSPLIATWITGRIIAKRPLFFLRQIHTIPAIFLTKIAWCWGASQTRNVC